MRVLMSVCGDLCAPKVRGLCACGIIAWMCLEDVNYVCINAAWPAMADWPHTIRPASQPANHD